jgi:hypothetical protein
LGYVVSSLVAYNCLDFDMNESLLKESTAQYTKKIGVPAKPELTYKWKGLS